MTDPVFPTDGRMLVAAANDTHQGGTAASRPVVANPYLRPRVIEPPAPPRQATIGTSGSIIVPPHKRHQPNASNELDMAVPGIILDGKSPTRFMALFAQLGQLRIYGIRATSHAQEPIEQPLMEEDTVPTVTVNRDVREKDTPSWHGE
eukprot:scaffold205778_cov34-Attheya_sp.AAC.1